MSRPDLSIVIASCAGEPFIGRCLRSVDAQRHVGNLECIVVDRVSGEVAEGIEREFPWVTLVRGEPGQSVPDLRREGVVRAQADYVAVIEEHCVAGKDWIRTILSCIEDKIAVVGGVVQHNDYRRLMDWAVYFTEYNSYMPPVERGDTYDVCAANCVYRRDLLLENLPESGSGYWEAVVNDKLLEAGHSFRAEPELVVHHTGPFGLRYYLGQRFLFSRAFGGVRRREVPAWYRGAYLVLAPLFVPVLWLRTARRVIGKRQRAGKFLMVSPHMIPILCVYVFGEWVGYLAGPGDSLSRIE